MDEHALVRTGYDAIAGDYLKARSKDSEDVHLLDELVQRLPRGAAVLDAGCGAGVPVALFLSQFFTVTGIDFSPEQIRRARASVPQVTFLCQDMTALAFAAESFDAICSYYAIIHIPRQEHRGILYTFHRLLKPGGLALLCLGAGDLEADVDENYFGTRMYWSHYDAETNLRLLQERGFQIIWAKRVADTSFPGADHLFVLAQKPQ